MTWFTRKPKVRVDKPRRPKFLAHAKPSIVGISFRELTDNTPANDGRYVYTYQWTEALEPVLGMRIVVPGGDGRAAYARIETLSPAPHAGALKPVIRIVPQAEIADAAIAASKALEVQQQQLAADTVIWLAMASKAAGLPSSSRRRNVPRGLPEIAPTEGNATPEKANEYGRMWWRAMKKAEESGATDETIKRFKSIASRWYAIRDRG